MSSKDHKRPVTERRVFNLTNCEVRSDGDGPATFSGYAAVFNELSVNLGGFRERIRPGAFRTAIEAGDDVRFLINHDANLILGRTPATLTLSEDETGLRVECDLPNTSYANDLAESMRRGDINQMSFGFTTRADAWPEKDAESGLPIRELVDVGLFDVSAVAYPAYPDTTAAVREIREAIETENPELLERAKRAAEELPEPEAAEEPEGEERAAEAHACGSTDLPLSGRDESWDASEAQQSLEPGDFANAHFWYDGGPADEIGSYHLPFAKRTDGGLEAVWKGVTAGAARLSETEGVDEKDVEAKMDHYYEAAAKKYDDDTIKAPWDDAGRDAGEPEETAEADTELADKTREAFEAFEQLRAEAGVRIEDDHPECDGVAVVWNWNDEIQTCCADRAEAEAQVEALTSGAAGAARSEIASMTDDQLLALLRAGKVLSKDNTTALTQAHQLLTTVLSAAGAIDQSMDDMAGAASTEPDETVLNSHTPDGEERELVMPDIKAFAAAAAERDWSYDDDWAIWSLTQMLESASCFLLYNGGQGDCDNDADQAEDDAQSATMKAIAEQLATLLQQIVSEAAARKAAADPEAQERARARAKRERQLRLLELEAAVV